jgi:hypothetical protein
VRKLFHLAATLVVLIVLLVATAGAALAKPAGEGEEYGHEHGTSESGHEHGGYSDGGFGIGGYVNVNFDVNVPLGDGEAYDVGHDHDEGY